jgi:hypothetical protein
MNNNVVIEQVLALADEGPWSGEHVARSLGRGGWQPAGASAEPHPAMWGSGEFTAQIFEVEREVALEVTFASWEVDLEDDYEEIDRKYALARTVVDELGTLFAERAGADWVAGAAVPSEFDDGFEHEHHVDWRMGGLSVVISVRHEDKELPVRAVLRIYNT